MSGHVHPDDAVTVWTCGVVDVLPFPEQWGHFRPVSSAVRYQGRTQGRTDVVPRVARWCSSFMLDPNSVQPHVVGPMETRRLLYKWSNPGSARR